MTDKDIEYAVGARYGLRTFKPAIVRDEPYLVSVAQDAIPVADPRFPVKAKWRELLTDSHPISWGDGTCKAVCTRATSTVYAWGGHPVAKEAKQFHEPPDKNCGCGIYALDDLRDLFQEYRMYTQLVVAVISASGRTIECQKGIRTQHARVVAYWVLDHHQSCKCVLCATRSRLPIHGAWSAWNDPDCFGSGRCDTFPLVECCQRRFVNADRWSEPDEMALHYGLKATPLPVHVHGRFLNGPFPGAKRISSGQYEFEIPWA